VPSAYEVLAYPTIEKLGPKVDGLEIAVLGAVRTVSTRHAEEGKRADHLVAHFEVLDAASYQFHDAH
jgi:hypothetical protein